MRFFVASLALAAVVSGCTTIDSLPEERLGEATIRLPSGIPIGSAQITRKGDRLTLSAAVAGIEPGIHGFHLHTTGKCIAPDFTSAGGHLNPGGKAHGSLSAGGKHLGDMPNLDVASNRTATAVVDLPGEPSNVMADLFDADGTAIVIHANADDYRTDPTGNAGSRIACGVFEAN
ncbi:MULTISPECIES: superoxide dismutase family protein [Qipengyuania]|uniref:Superoxide dismutase family protein n=1 Tax=Qipengyuania soli TaxID=2782568 RepID=A0A7S8F3Q2_9SPHN|nr:superoxide dismutase family protein [Qipengyuania soli]QPC98558.1 superoxide dismutase family protein [Qipengyuania soli]